jgi:hypothetical protein
MIKRRAPRITISLRGRDQLDRPIRVGPSAVRAVMAGDEVDGCGISGLAAFTAHAAEQGLEGHVAVAFDQQPHGIADRTATSAMQAMQLDHARGPVREPVRFAERGRVHPPFLDRNR